MNKDPLYYAIRKYGKEHFSIELLEETSLEESEDKEKYYIQLYDSYKNGYNATLGGDGKTYLDHEKILWLFDNTDKSQREIAQECNCSKDSVKEIVRNNRTDPNWKERFLESHCLSRQKVFCVEQEKTFNSIVEAAEWFSLENPAITLKNIKISITKTCQGKQKTSYGFHWHLVELDDN